MEITNDPRFFQELGRDGCTRSVLSVRLAAFASLGVVAGLMVQNSFDHLFDMSKRMSFHPDSLDGYLVAWSLNVIATYVGVAQPYHTIRLMTAGPSGDLDGNAVGNLPVGPQGGLYQHQRAFAFPRPVCRMHQR
eukprot:Skav217211  [mRNA]  locus=scaffold143:190099:191889:- [translate_table: standard]